MPNDNRDHRDQAAEYWRAGKPLEAGKLIFESLPRDTRPKWAARILTLVLDRSGIERSHFERVLYDADNQRMWADAHRAFDNLRKATLQLEDLQKKRRLTKDEELLAGILLLAENVAKVTYNATDPPDEFDEDSGWWIAACLKGFVDNVWHDDAFSKAAWLRLCSEDG